MKILGIAFLCVLTFAGCASIVSKSDWPVTFNSAPEGATIKVTDANGAVVFKGTTPTTVTLQADNGFFSKARYIVESEQNGKTSTMTINAQVNGWYFGNLLFGGIIGMLIVDPATGAMWRLNKNVFLNAEEQSAALSSAGGENLQIASIHDIPQQFRAELVPLN